MKQRTKTYKLRTWFPGYGVRTIICHGWNDAVRLRRRFGGKIL
ncbi:MAG TPA: hypothetical protein VJQ25_14445 [Nitrospira sp.]|nr:hypothetical protein [Nitrospira sp.]